MQGASLGVLEIQIASFPFPLGDKETSVEATRLEDRNRILSYRGGIFNLIFLGFRWV